MDAKHNFIKDSISQKTFESSLKLIQDEYNKVVEENTILRNKNSELKEEHYKDNEIARLKEQLDKSRRKCNHYGLEDVDYQELIDWWEKHKQEKHKDAFSNESKIKTKMSYVPYYHFEIEETSVATCYEIKCTCGEHHDIFY